MTKIKKVLKKTCWILGVGILLMTLKQRVYAAFPADLDTKNMKAYSLASEDITVYSDEGLTEEYATVSGDGLVLNAVDVSGDQKALYGKYTNEVTGESGEGWIPSSVFLYDNGFKHVYATLRSGTTVYTSSSLSTSRLSVRKYSGVIALGKANGAVQVVYEKGDHYGIGWISAEDYDNKLVYDGRDKQTLADGSYNFVTAEEIEKSPQAQNYPCQTFTLKYAGKKLYKIFDVKQNKYLTLTTSKIEETSDQSEEEPEWMSHGLIHSLKYIFSPSYREKIAKWKQSQKEYEEAKKEHADKIANGEIYEDAENNLSYMITYTEDENAAGLFYLERQGDYFSLSCNKISLYLGNNSDQTTILTSTDQPSKEYLWRTRAVQSLVDSSNPMVFTQYDPAWCGTAYGSEGCIGTAGCGLLATVNAVYALTGQYMSVMELRDYAVDKGYRIEGSGTDEGIFKASALKYGDKYGFEWDGASGKFKYLKKKLQKGDVAIVHVIGHYVAITAYDEKNDKYLLLDSNCLPKRETTAFGDWVSASRLTDGYLYGQNYYYYKLK